MARPITPFGNLILFIRVLSAISGFVAVVTFSIFMRDVIRNYLDGDIPFAALPIVAGGIVVIWNIVSIVIMLRPRIPFTIITSGDGVILLATIVLGVPGVWHESVVFVDTGYYFDSAASLLVLEIGGVALLFAAVAQVLLILFMALEHRHVRETGRKEVLPTYHYPQVAAAGSGDEHGTDWTSTRSTEKLPEVRRPEQLRKPVPAVEPKSRYNPLTQ